MASNWESVRSTYFPGVDFTNQITLQSHLEAFEFTITLNGGGQEYPIKGDELAKVLEDFYDGCRATQLHTLADGRQKLAINCNSLAAIGTVRTSS